MSFCVLKRIDCGPRIICCGRGAAGYRASRAPSTNAHELNKEKSGNLKANYALYKFVNSEEISAPYDGGG
jgi:hypothetical protein